MAKKIGTGIIPTGEPFPDCHDQEVQMCCCASCGRAWLVKPQEVPVLQARGCRCKGGQALRDPLKPSSSSREPQPGPPSPPEVYRADQQAPSSSLGLQGAQTSGSRARHSHPPRRSYEQYFGVLD